MDPHHQHTALLQDLTAQAQKDLTQDTDMVIISYSS